MATYQRTTTIQPQQSGVGATAANVATTLSDRLSQFAARREEDIARRRLEQGQQAGTIAGQEAAIEGQEPARKEPQGLLGKLFGQSYYDQAYNVAADESYLAANAVNVRAKIDEVAGSSETTEQFDQRMKSLRDGMLKGADMRFHAAINQQLIEDGSRARVGVMKAQQEKALKQIKFNILSDAEDLRERSLDALASGDDSKAADYEAKWRARLNQGLEVGLYTPQQYIEQERAFNNEAIERMVYANADKALKEGRGVQYAKKIFETDLSGYDGDPEKLKQGVMERMSRFNRLMDHQDAQSNRIRTLRHEEGTATLREMQINGTLDLDTVNRFAMDDKIPDSKYDYWKKAAIGGDVDTDDEEARLAMESDPLSFTEEQIADADLTTATKSKILEARRKQELEWRGERWARDLTERMRGTYGVSPTGEADPEATRKANLAIQDWHDQVEEYLAEGHTSAEVRTFAKETADALIKDERVSNLETSYKEAEARVQRFEQQMKGVKNPESMMIDSLDRARKAKEELLKQLEAERGR